jgi:protocatechuate 3,4-dioxygenase beta subunit
MRDAENLHSVNGSSHAGHGHHDPSREHHHAGEPVPIFDRGLAFDVGTLLGRRQMLGLIAAAGLVPLTGRLVPAAASSTLAACREIPEETAGPFPADGSNGPNILDDVGIVRKDIRSSFGEAAPGKARGVQLQVKLTVLNASDGCTPYEGAAVYIWHCDREGRYSIYSPGVEDQNYLRGVQAANAAGKLTFNSVFPGCYVGRWPHIHFEVYPDLDEATSFRNKIATSQLAFPRKTCKRVYAKDGYEQSVINFADVSLKTDSVFSDGWKDEMATMTGSPEQGYVASLAIAV